MLDLAARGRHAERALDARKTVHRQRYPERRRISRPRASSNAGSVEVRAATLGVGACRRQRGERTSSVGTETAARTRLEVAAAAGPHGTTRQNDAEPGVTGHSEWHIVAHATIFGALARSPSRRRDVTDRGAERAAQLQSATKGSLRRPGTQGQQLSGLSPRVGQCVEPHESVLALAGEADVNVLKNAADVTTVITAASRLISLVISQ